MRTIKKGLYCGEMCVPPSKSLLHRALICAAFASGRSVIHNISLCDDIEATISCLKSLGATIKIVGNNAIIDGITIDEIKENAVLDCRESGSTLRFLIPFAIISGKNITFKGRERLFERPLLAYQTLCCQNGIKMDIEGTRLTISGEPLENGFFTIDGSVSSQFVSGLMLALPHLHGYSVIEIEGESVSKPYIAMTFAVLKEFGVNLSISDRIVVPSCLGTIPTEYTIEGDWSAASSLLCMNAVGSEIDIKGLSDDSIQGDRIVKLLIGRLKRGKAEIDISDCPDLAPSLMALAPFFHGARFVGTNRLSGKESNRGEAMITELSKFGIKASKGEDYIDIEETDELPENIDCSSHNDHRIAMALMILLSYTGGSMDNTDCVNKSFPDFFDILDTIIEK